MNLPTRTTQLKQNDPNILENVITHTHTHTHTEEAMKIGIFLTATTESRAATDKMSAQDTTPGQELSN